MAKKATPTTKKVAAPITKTIEKSTPVRNTPIPKVAPAAAIRKAITHSDIATRAYLIGLSGTGSDETGNWLRAERELRGE